MAHGNRSNRAMHKTKDRQTENKYIWNKNYFNYYVITLAREAESIDEVFGVWSLVIRIRNRQKKRKITLCGVCSARNSYCICGCPTLSRIYSFAISTCVCVRPAPSAMCRCVSVIFCSLSIAVRNNYFIRNKFSISYVWELGQLKCTK